MHPFDLSKSEINPSTMAVILDESQIIHHIKCVEMHTTGEPTRVIYEGFPDIQGTLLEQRAQAKREYDHVRRRLILEPRGHYDMYAAVLRPRTELTESGEAHMGTLFMTNDGFSTMCGHATIALGRFLLDTSEAIFPQRANLKHDPNTNTALLKLHAPCGLLEVTVPTSNTGTTSDPSRPVSFISVPSFATGVSVHIPVTEDFRWPQLGHRDSVIGDFSYGGAFYCMIHATELGFDDGLANPNIPELNFATKQLKAAIKANPNLHELFQHPDHEDLGFLYSIIVVDKSLPVPVPSASASASTPTAETGLCFFASQQIDRSPTGSGVAARIALAIATSTLPIGEKRTYHSLVSNRFHGKGAFIGSAVAVKETPRHANNHPVVKVCVEGFAYYTGYSDFFVEQSDPMGDDGFVFGR